MMTNRINLLTGTVQNEIKNNDWRHSPNDHDDNSVIPRYTCMTILLYRGINDSVFCYTALYDDPDPVTRDHCI